METNLAQSEAKITIEGQVNDLSLEESNKDGKQVISGYVTVKTDENNLVKVNTYANKITKDGNESKIYQGLLTVKNEYKSIAKDGAEEADWVRISGDLNPYTNAQTHATTMGYKSNFFNRIQKDKAEPKAEFSVEIFFQAIIPETKNGEETGRAIVKGWMPTYNGIEPIEMVAPEGLADEALDYFENGNTYKVMGDIIANLIREEKEISVGLGKSRTEVHTSFKNELVITGVSEPYDEDEGTKPYDKDAIQLAIQQREDNLNNAQSSHSKNSNTKPSGIASGRTLDF